MCCQFVNMGLSLVNYILFLIFILEYAGRDGQECIISGKYVYSYFDASGSPT
jgi:hypothetical protein